MQCTSLYSEACCHESETKKANMLALYNTINKPKGTKRRKKNTNFNVQKSIKAIFQRTQ
jgi:hypothetical protein